MPRRNDWLWAGILGLVLSAFALLVGACGGSPQWQISPLGRNVFITTV